MVQTYSGWQPHCMAACRSSFVFFSSTVDQALQGLPTITQLAQHLPSHQCPARKCCCFTSFFSFSSSSVYLAFFAFPNGNFEVDWCCLFRANGSKHKEEDEEWVEGWEETVRSHEGNLDFTQRWGSFKIAPMCSLFQLGFDGKWSEARVG